MLTLIFTVLAISAAVLAVVVRWWWVIAGVVWETHPDQQDEKAGRP